MKVYAKILVTIESTDSGVTRIILVEFSTDYTDSESLRKFLYVTNKLNN